MSTPPSWGMPYVLAALAAVLAIVLARRRVEHRPVALFLSVMIALDVARLVLRASFDLGLPGPYEGARRLAFHADELGVLAWPAGLAALALVVFAGRRRPWAVLAAWCVVGAALIALYPSELVRGDGLRRVYLAHHLVALAVYLVTLVRWAAGRQVPGSEHAVLLLLGAAEVVRVASFSVFIVGQWGTWMPPANAVLYAVIAAVEGGVLWIRRR